MDHPPFLPDGRLAPRTYVHRRNGQSMQLKLSESLIRRYEAAKLRLFLVTAKNPSQSIIARRAMDMYLQNLSRMPDEGLKDEVQALMSHR